MFSPLNDKVLVEVICNKKTAGGLFIPDNAMKNGFVEGVVKAIGAGRVSFAGARVEPLVKVGDKVVLLEQSLRELVINNEKLYVIIEDDIVGVLK